MTKDLTHAQHLITPAFMVICDGQCDSINSTMAIAKREAKDLKRMGHDDVKVKAFASWAEAHAHEDKLRGY